MWGTLLNTDFSLIDSALAGELSLSVAGNSTIVLTGNDGSADQSRNAYFNLSGTLTGNISVLFPEGRTQTAIVKNNTTGNFTLSIGSNNGSGSAAGTTYTVPQGEVTPLYNDGANITLAATPAGIGAPTIGSPFTTHAPVIAASAGGLKSTAALTDGQLLIGQTGNDPAPETLSGAATLAANGTLTLTGTTRKQYISVISANGTFSIPANATADTVFDIICIGGGGGSGGSGGANATGGGGSGGAREAFFSGFTPSTNITIVIGAAGAAGVGSTPTSGTAGGTTTVTYNAVAIMTSGGGFGSDLNGGDITTTSGNAGTSSATAGASGLTLVAQNSLGAQAGTSVDSASLRGGIGGGNAIGQGGNPGNVISGPSHTNPTAGVAGGGGGGAWQGAFPASNVNGAAGGPGVVIIKYIL